jgi:hypothetical protein
MFPVAEISNPSDEFAPRFLEFIANLTTRLGTSAVVVRQSLTPMITETSFEPTNQLACPVSILEMSDKGWILFISRGGRWELVQSSKNLAFIENLVIAAIEGQVFETIRPGGARVTVTTSDGKIHKSGVQGSKMFFFAERKNWYRRHGFAPYQ